MNNKMNKLRKSVLFMLILGALIISWNSASAMTDKIILFHDGVSPSKANKFIKHYRKERGAVLVNRFPFMNGIIIARSGYGHLCGIG